MSGVVLAVDLGGTKLEAALVDTEGDIFAGTRNRVPTGPESTPERLTAAVRTVVAGALAALPAGASLVGAGIGSAGPLRRQDGTIFPVNMPAARGFALCDAVTSALGASGLGAVPVHLGHDGECLALAEARWGAARDARASLSIVVSTGIGGGFVIDGRPLHGASGNAGHIGQTLARGHGATLEQVASGPATVAWARAQGWRGEDGPALGISAAAGDEIARAAIERSAVAVGGALADAATLVDLDVVVIGGGFSQVSDDYVPRVARALAEAAVLGYARRTRVVPAALGGEGPLVGAAALVPVEVEGAGARPSP